MQCKELLKRVDARDYFVEALCWRILSNLGESGMNALVTKSLEGTLKVIRTTEEATFHIRPDKADGSSEAIAAGDNLDREPDESELPPLEKGQIDEL